MSKTIFAVTFCFFVFCSFAASAQERARIGWAAMTVSHVPLWVAQEKGFLVKNGLVPELIFFGAGTFRQLPDIISRHGKQLLLVTGGKSPRQSTPRQNLLRDPIHPQGAGRWVPGCFAATLPLAALHDTRFLAYPS